MKLSLIPVLAAIFVVAGCGTMNRVAYHAPPGEMKETVVCGVRLRYPAGGKIKMERPQADFFLFEFTYSGRVVLNGYIGTAPTPFRKLGKSRREGNALVSMTSSAANGSVSKEVLCDWGKGKPDLPKYIHFWYNHLTVSDALIADRIIAETLSVNQ
jgi:hypothetical protein